LEKERAQALALEEMAAKKKTHHSFSAKDAKAKRLAEELAAIKATK